MSSGQKRQRKFSYYNRHVYGFCYYVAFRDVFRKLKRKKFNYEKRNHVQRKTIDVAMAILYAIYQVMK